MSEQVPTVVYTSTHAVSGTMSLAERMQDSLSSSLSEFVELSDASIYRIAQPSHPPVSSPMVATPKSAIELIALDVDETARMPSSLAKRQPKPGQPVLVILAGIEIRGMGYVGPIGQSPSEVLNSQRDLFFAVTDAQLSFTQSDELNVTTKVALVARSKVKNLAVG